MSTTARETDRESETREACEPSEPCEPSPILRGTVELDLLLPRLSQGAEDGTSEGTSTTIGNENGIPQRAVQRAMAVLRANGYDSESIARLTELPLATVRKVMNLPWFCDLVLEMQTELKMPLEVRIANAAVPAFEQHLRLLHTAKNEVVRERIAQNLLDRALGKAVQRTESINLNMNSNASLDEIRTQRELVAQRVAQLEEKRKQLMSQVAAEVDVKN